jgi:altronate dehydratase
MFKTIQVDKVTYLNSERSSYSSTSKYYELVKCRFSRHGEYMLFSRSNENVATIIIAGFGCADDRVIKRAAEHSARACLDLLRLQQCRMSASYYMAPAGS